MTTSANIEVDLVQGLQISPNPTDEITNIIYQTPSPGMIQLELLTVDGRIVKPDGTHPIP